MKILTQIKEDEIRNRLDVVNERLYSEDAHFEDMYSDLSWSHQTIKDLLFMIYMLQINKKEREDSESG